MHEAAPAALHAEVCDLLGCDYPVVLAGMGGVARSDLALAVTRGGGFGFLGMVREPPGLICCEVEAMRRESSRSFGINIIPAATEPGLLAGQVKTCIDLRVPVIALFWDLLLVAFATQARLSSARSARWRREGPRRTLARRF